MATFIANRWSGNDNAVFPDQLEIDTSIITYFKGTIVGYHKSVIPRDRIASVHLRSGLMFADVIIETFGGQEVIARGFAKRDARTILNALS